MKKLKENLSLLADIASSLFVLTFSTAGIFVVLLVTWKWAPIWFYMATH